MGRDEEETVAFEDVEALRETDKALLCNINGEEHWIPKSQIHDNSEVFDEGENSRGKLVLTAWIAEVKGLI
jgi:hypothetical protein